MKKLLITLLALTSIAGFANETYDYSNAFTKLEESQRDQYKEVPADVRNATPDGVGVVTPRAGENDVTDLNGNFLIEKSLDTGKVLIFSHEDPNYSNIDKLNSLDDSLYQEGNTTKLHVTAINTGYNNNKPLFIYAYNKTTGQIHKIYKSDGTRASFRQINTEDFSDVTEEKINDGSFAFGNGYVEANKIYKTALGEIKDTTKTGEELEFDRAAYAVSGKTVYDYIKKNKDEASLETPTDSLITDTKVKAALDALSVSGSSEFDLTEGDTPVLEYKTNKTVDKIYRGIAAPIQDNDAANKKYVDDAIASISGDMTSTKAGISTAVAIANLPIEFTKDKPNSFAAAFGYYGKHVGFALGYGRKALKDNSLTLKVTSSINTAADFAAGAGVGYSW